jgi:hypothetical protein
MCILGVLGIDYSRTCDLFPIGWSFYSFRCNNTCWDWHFPIWDDITKCPNHVIISCSFLGPTLGKPNGSILSLVVIFFGKLPTRVKVFLIFSRCSFEYRVNTFSFMCGSRGKRLVISSSYHAIIPLLSTHFLTTPHTHFGLPHPIISHLSWCHYDITIDNLGTHLFWCPSRSEHTTTRNTFRNIVVAIVLENGTHVQKEVSHLFLRHTQ